MKVYGFKAEFIFIVNSIICVFISVYSFAQLNELVNRPFAFLDDIVHIVDCHITVLINKHILVEEAGVHHVKEVGGYVAGGEIELVVYCCGGDERFRPPGLFKVKVLKFEKILHKTVHCERSSGHAVSCKDIVSAAA